MAISSPNTMGMAAAPVKATLVSNYIDFTSNAGNNGWQQQFLPDLMDKEAEVYGNRSVSGFLAQVGAEEAMSSDQVVWSEQGRLHLTYTAKWVSSGIIEIENDIDGNDVGNDAHGIRVGDTVIISASTGKTVKGYVSVIAAVTNQITVLPYSQAALDAGSLGTPGTGTETLRVLVYGSERAKGTAGRTGANKPSFKSIANKPIILKDKYEISGSDASQIGWVEVSGEEGQNGYYWYVKAEAETRTRFGDYLEMAMVESERAAATSVIDDATGGLGDGSGAGGPGTEGLFSAIETRGHVSTGVTGVNAATDLAEFDAMLAKFDENGAIEENMMFVNRATALAMDDMLASMNSYGAGGTSYGVFDNNEDMALNLGFSGFRRGSYDFYKSDWKYLNDNGTRGAINANDTVNAIRGVVVPAGVSSVYDQQLGKNLKRPFLHVRYRASQTESRKMKTWITGSVGAVTSDLDAMEVHFLSERCLVVQGANNFMLLK
jgi:hypothetical protein